MIVTAWNNGRHHQSGAGYGLKLNAADRDRFFKPQWQTVSLVLEGQTEPVAVNVAKPSFWGPSCRELIHQEIGRWLRENGLAPWPKGHPPRLELVPLEGNRFSLQLPSQ